jgi:hypothetical protein
MAESDLRVMRSTTSSGGVLVRVGVHETATPKLDWQTARLPLNGDLGGDQTNHGLAQYLPTQRSATSGRTQSR